MSASGGSTAYEAADWSAGRTPRWGTVAALVAALGFAAVLVATVRGESAAGFAAPGGQLLYAGALAAMCGTYLLLLTIMLAARPALLERAVGQDRLLHWHRRTATPAVILLLLHAAFVTAGTIERSSPHFVLLDYAGHTSVLTAAIGLALLVLAAVTSSLALLRRYLQRRTWWTVHLLVYPAAALSFWHTLTGPTFPGHRTVTAAWDALWIWTAALVLYNRMLVPLVRTLRHRLVVAEVRQETPDVVSVICEGRYLDRIGVLGGQYFQWRFLERHLVWHAHPYSVSAMPDNGRVRLTVKRLGRASGILHGIGVGTSVLIEGPYGRFTKRAARTRRIVLTGAGIGLSPVRALLEDLSPQNSITVIVVAADEAHVVFRDEMDTLARARGASIHLLLGGRRATRLDRELLFRLCPDIARSDVFVCGPAGFTREVRAASRALGTPANQIHYEDFSA